VLYDTINIPSLTACCTLLVSAVRCLYVLYIACICCTLLVCAVHCLYVLYIACMCCTLLVCAVHCLYLLYIACMCCTLLVSAVHCLYLLYIACMCCTLLVSAVHCLYVLYIACMCCTLLVCALHCLYVLYIACMCCTLLVCAVHCLYVLYIACMCCTLLVCAVHCLLPVCVVAEARKCFDLAHLKKCKAAPVPAFKACRRSRGTAPSTLNPGISLKMSGQLHASAVLHPVIQNRSLGGPHSRAGLFGEEKNILPQPGIESPNSLPDEHLNNLSFLFCVWLFMLKSRRLQSKRISCHVVISVSSGNSVSVVTDMAEHMILVRFSLLRRTQAFPDVSS
jgi:hypothetical protein